MAKNFVLIRVGLHETAEVLGIAATLGIPAQHVVGCLSRVWSWARDEMDESGTVRVPENVIDGLAAVPGFAAAMKAQQWLSADETSVTFPHPQRWITRDAVKRAQSRQRAERKRARDATQSAHQMRTKRAPEEEEEEEREEEQDNGCAVDACASVAAAEPDFSPSLRAEVQRRLASKCGVPVSQIPGTIVTEVVTYTAGQPSSKREAAVWPGDAAEPMDRLHMIQTAFDVADAEATSTNPNGLGHFVISVMEPAIAAGLYPELGQVPKRDTRSQVSKAKQRRQQRESEMDWGGAA